MIETHNAAGELDEIHADNCHVQLQRGGEHWFALTIDDGVRRIMLSIGTAENYRRKVNARIFSDTFTESTKHG